MTPEPHTHLKSPRHLFTPGQVQVDCPGCFRFLAIVARKPGAACQRHRRTCPSCRRRWRLEIDWNAQTVAEERFFGPSRGTPGRDA